MTVAGRVRGLGGSSESLWPPLPPWRRFLLRVGRVPAIITVAVVTGATASVAVGATVTVTSMAAVVAAAMRQASRAMRVRLGRLALRRAAVSPPTWHSITVAAHLRLTVRGTGGLPTARGLGGSGVAISASEPSRSPSRRHVDRACGSTWGAAAFGPGP